MIMVILSEDISSPERHEQNSRNNNSPSGEKSRIRQNNFDNNKNKTDHHPTLLNRSRGGDFIIEHPFKCRLSRPFVAAHLVVSFYLSLILILTSCSLSPPWWSWPSPTGVARAEQQSGGNREQALVHYNHYGRRATATATSATAAGSSYQPSLIGFRCEISRDITSNGVSVIEANRPVTLTLYGEYFSTNTIVAFTNEFKADADADDVDDDGSSYNASPTTTTTTTPIIKSSTATGTETNELGQAPTGRPLVSAAGAEAMGALGRRKFEQRRKHQSTSYDCTDYNRVTSYRLTRDNILSPNVVTLTVTLPELDAGAGMYYYFCIKQPKLTPAAESRPPIAGGGGAGADSGLRGNKNNNSNKTHDSEQLAWVHQGVQWWVTLKVEPPILTVTYDIVLIVFLLFLSAVTSGLNLGLMSLDMNELAVISSCGDHKERSYARTIAPLRKRGNYLLCSLLLGNVMVNSTLTVILEELTSGLIAVIGSTLAIVVLGEIVPQAFCARQGLAIGAKTIYLTYAFMILTFPLSYPISRLLDWVLGEEKGNVYDRERLMEFIRITGHHTQLEADEVAIISGALKLKKIKVDQIMTRIEDVFMLPIDCKLDRDTIKRIIEKGYSRIPVYEFGDRKQIVALILAKDLALIDPDDHTPIASMLMYCKHPLIFIQDDTTLDVALNEFKTGKSHMAVVRQIYDDGEIDKYYEAIGVVTLEDVIEEVLQAEINDETDTLSDNRRKRRRTDAQVAHLIDELTSSSGPGAGGTGANTPKVQPAPHFHSGKDGAPHSMGAGQLASQLTEVSISGLAQALSGQALKSQQAAASSSSPPPPLGYSPSMADLSYSPSVMSQYHSIELSSSPSVASPSSGTKRQPSNNGQAAAAIAQGNSPTGDLQQQQQSRDEPTEAGGGGGLLSRASQFINQMMG